MLLYHCNVMSNLQACCLLLRPHIKFIFKFILPLFCGLGLIIEIVFCLVLIPGSDSNSLVIYCFTVSVTLPGNGQLII